MIAFVLLAELALSQVTQDAAPTKWSVGAGITGSSFAVGSSGVGGLLGVTSPPRLSFGLERKFSSRWAVLGNALTQWHRTLPQGEDPQNRSSFSAALGMGVRRFFGDGNAKTRPSVDARIEYGYSRVASVSGGFVGADGGFEFVPMSSRVAAHASGFGLTFGGAVDHLFTPSFGVRAGASLASVRREWTSLVIEGSASPLVSEREGSTWSVGATLSPFLEARLHF